MRIVLAVLGAVLLLAALASFFRSFWRGPPKRERDEYSPEGSSSAFGTDSTASGHDGVGGHGGAEH